MLPTVFTIPLPGGGSLPIKGYGLMLMLGFLSGIYMCMRRAQKVRSDPDTVLNAGFLALIFGVFGARLFYVVHYWDTQFAGRGLWAAIDVTSGGLEFYGGFLAAVAAILIYLRISGHSARLFLDIMAPGVMWGLAFGRMGCFLNGCCFGGTCPPSIPFPLAVTFPYGSPAHIHHFQTNRVALPRELMYVDTFGWVRPILREHIAMTPEEIFGPRNKHREAIEQLQEALKQVTPPEASEKIVKAWRRFDAERRTVPRGAMAQMNREEFHQTQARIKTAYQELQDACASVPNGKNLLKLIKGEHQAWDTRETQAVEIRDLLGDSRNPRPKAADIQSLQKLAGKFRSHTVYAAQVFGIINALIISGILSLFFYRRRVHGAVFGLMFVIYPITRFILEWIRADNPIDSGGMTISQAISVGIVPLALVYLLVIYHLLPPQSPRAKIWIPPAKEPPPPSNEPSRLDETPREQTPSTSANTSRTVSSASAAEKNTKVKGKGRSVVETVVVPPKTTETDDQNWVQTEAICAKCGARLLPPDGLIYQSRAAKRAAHSLTPGVAEIECPDPNTVMELICDECFDRRPPQDKTRGKRLAKKWWKTGKV